MSESQGKRQIQSVDTALRLIEILQEQGGAGVTELADELGLNKGTVHTHLSTLRENEYVIKDGDTYRLSLKFLDLGEFVKQRVEFYDVAGNEVADLAEESGEVAQFATEEHGKAVYICKSSGEQAVQTASRTGMREYLHCLSLGKAMLSVIPRERVEAIVDRHGLPEYTNETITTREELFEELDQIRERGYATDDGEKIPGLRCVAAPVVANDDTVIGAISVTGPASRMQGERWRETLPNKVTRSANVIQINSQFSD